MNFFIENIYTAVLVPFWVMLLLFTGRLFSVIESKRTVSIISISSSIYCLIFSILAFIPTVLQKGLTYEAYMPFINISNFNFSLGVYADSVSMWFLLLATIISLFVQIYSCSYMKNDTGYIRFFALLNLFCFAMYGLILSPNLFQMYIFWELVGVASYLLIGFWYKNNEVSIAAKKTFIINRIGDFSFLSGIILAAYIIFTNLNNIASIALPFSDMPNISAQIYGCTSDGIFILTCILILLGAVAKSAQFPLHTWLIDAMKGPTPVSALIHSATMVAAGVFLLVRLYPLFSLNNVIMNIISIIGIITAIICSYSAITQTDIKKILAYSTNAQLGLMFLAVGSCSVSMTLFHLTSHALAKAMLFLSAGSIIYALGGKQDITQAGGLRKKLPVQASVFMIGVISLSGLLFSGFASKEMILGNLIETKQYFYAVTFIFIAFMTAYYLFRLYFYLFEGEKRYEDEPNKLDLRFNYIPLLLGILVITLWFVLPKSGNFFISLINYIVSIFAISAAALVYFNRKIFKKIPVLFDLSYNSFYSENILSLIVLLYNYLSKIFKNIEKYIFDGISYLSYVGVRLFAIFYSKVQTGNIQSYLAYSLFLIMICLGGVMLVYSIIIYLSEV